MKKSELKKLIKESIKELRENEVNNAIEIINSIMSMEEQITQGSPGWPVNSANSQYCINTTQQILSVNGMPSLGQFPGLNQNWHNTLTNAFNSGGCQRLMDTFQRKIAQWMVLMNYGTMSQVQTLLVTSPAPVPAGATPPCCGGARPRQQVQLFARWKYGLEMWRANGCQ